MAWPVPGPTEPKFIDEWQRPITENDIGLKVLRHPKLGCNLEDIIDVVAVHGMAAHPSYTWCQKISNDKNQDNNDEAQNQHSEGSQYINWLEHEEMLPALLPTARIMRYGYRSDGWGADGVRTRGSDISQRLIFALQKHREGCEERPLIFIAHSYGGLVILRTLLDGKLEPSKYRGIYNSTIGLVFFSTPFRGTDTTFSSHGELLQRAEQLHNSVYKENYEIFRSGDDNLLDVVDNFLRTTRDDVRPRIICFYEKRVTDIGRFLQRDSSSRHESMSVLLVNEHSGCLDSDASTDKFSRACDHLQMNKFRDKDDEDFQRLSSELSKMFEQRRDIIARRSKLLRDLLLSLGANELPEAREKILEWLSKQANHTLHGKNHQITRHKALLKKHYANTGEWVFQRQEFRNWMHIKRLGADKTTSPSLLWLHGRPGVGKSVMVADIVRRLEPETVLSLYCEYDHRKSQTRQSLLCYGIRQLIEKLDPLQPLPKDVCDAWAKYHTDTGGLPVEECPNLLVSLVKQVKKCFIVLDGLDEYVSDDGGILRSRYPVDIFEDLHAVTKKCEDVCRMLVASRDNIYYRYKRRIEACDIEVEAQKEDIAEYISSRLLSPEFKFYQDLQEEEYKGLREEIVERLTSKAQGLFLLPTLHLQIIEGKRSLRRVQESLEKLPEKLFDMYQLILLRIKNETKDEEDSGLDIIQIILCSARRLHLIELQHALATEECDDEFVGSGLVKLEEILSTTGGLLSIGDDQTILFMHHTVGEYLNKPEVFAEYFSGGQLCLARKCLTYVSFKSFKEPCEKIDRLFQQYPFLRYAACHLGYHVSKCIETDSITIDEVKEFLEQNLPLASLQVVASKILTIPSADRMAVLSQQSSTLHLAILWGIKPLVRLLVSGGANIEARGFKDVTPLQMAATAHSVSSTKILIDKKANVSAIDVEGRTALDLILQRAWRGMIIRVGDWHLLRFLMLEMNKYMKELESKNPSEKSPEECAAEKILREKSRIVIDVTVTVEYIMNDLMWDKLRTNKAHYEYLSGLIIETLKLDITDDGEEVAIMLIDAGVDVNSVEVQEASSLQLAALFGRERLVRKLLDHNANPFVQGLLGFTALDIAKLRATKFPENIAFKSIATLIHGKMEEALRREEQQTDDLQKLTIPGPTQAKALEAKKDGAFDRMLQRMGIRK